MRWFCFILWFLIPTNGIACGLALVLAVDVSGSVDRQEYKIQMQGLADALRDGIVSDSLVAQQAQLTLLQWTGASRQRQSLPWATIRTHADVEKFATMVEQDARVWRNYSTAIGEALWAAKGLFETVGRCTRKVIDVSGDGKSNEGVLPAEPRNALRSAGVTVNALAIETDETDLTAYFFEHVITGPRAFVMTADGFEDYPVQIRRKLQREASERMSALR